MSHKKVTSNNGGQFKKKILLLLSAELLCCCAVPVTASQHRAVQPAETHYEYGTVDSSTVDYSSAQSQHLDRGIVFG